MAPCKSTCTCQPRGDKLSRLRPIILLLPLPPLRDERKLATERRMRATRQKRFQLRISFFLYSRAFPWKTRTMEFQGIQLFPPPPPLSRSVVEPCFRSHRARFSSFLAGFFLSFSTCREIPFCDPTFGFAHWISTVRSFHFESRIRLSFAQLANTHVKISL